MTRLETLLTILLLVGSGLTLRFWPQTTPEPRPAVIYSVCQGDTYDTADELVRPGIRVRKVLRIPPTTPDSMQICVTAESCVTVGELRQR